jgi:hypothetical protein
MQDICAQAVDWGTRIRGALAYRVIGALLCIVAVCAAQLAPGVKELTVYNRPAVQVENGQLEVAILKQGGAMLRIRIQGDAQGISPFGNPELVPSVPDNRKLMGPMVGHFVCVDGFGPPSKEEAAAGLPMHGEAYLQPWRQVSAEQAGGITTVRFAVDLPKSQETFTRSLQMVQGESVIYVDSELASQTAFDRTANWGEHPFLFPPFLERDNTVIDISGTRSKTRTYPANTRPGTLLTQSTDFSWPAAPASGGGAFDMRATPVGVNGMGHTTTLMDPERRLAWVTVLNKARHYLLGYVFRREEYPWVQNYMQYSASDWIGRGVEFATQPFDLPHRDMVELNRMFDAPVYRWLPAKSKISTRFLLFYVKAPDGMTRVDEVRLEEGKLIVEDRASGKTVTLAASQPL